MAVRIDDYYERFRSRTLVALIFAQATVVVLSIGLLWWLLAVYNLPLMYAASASGAIFIGVNIFILVMTFNYITEPIKVIAQAINHVSKQLSDLPPPEINKKRYERSGLKMMVQTIYELALNAPAIPNSIPTLINQAAAKTTAKDEASKQAANILNALPCGVVGLNQNGEITYANAAAPVSIGPDQKNQLKLVFEPDKGLKEWLSNASGKVRDSIIWTRIPSDLPDTNDRKFYDVMVAYEKGSSSGFETLIITIDRTNTYAAVEEDMDFIALAAHELRGPITVIRGYLDVLNDELQPVMQPDQSELIERISVSANRLSSYINNVLNVSRYDRKNLKIHLHEDDLLSIVETLRTDLEMRARTQNRLLSFGIPADLPHIAADRNSLSEVISNLVDNAIKYSNEGGQIIVSATTKGDSVECTVQDFGIGIPGSVIGNLFGKFYRSHRSRQAVAGTGLGLYITKALIESHGGQVWVRSTEGQGSTFGFTVPVYAAVADKLLLSGNNQGIIESAHGWIKNHAMYRR